MLRRLLPLTIALSLASSSFAQSSAGTRPAAAKPAVVVNVNTASAAEFEALPGVGAKVAARIVEYRQKNGPFKKIEELMNVQGIGEKSFLQFRGQLTVGQ